MPELLTLREDPQNRDLTVRTIALRADSLDEQTRSVEAIVATEDVVTVFDMSSWELIDEVLRMDGAQLPEDVGLLADHNRFTIDAVLGSARQFRSQGAELYARLYFAEGEANSPEERAYRKVKGKHLRNVSAGYRALEYTDIPAGQTAVVKGRTYTAGQRRLRISTRWEPREVSLVPIGADKRSKIRADHNPSPFESPMNPQLRAFLESIGLRKEATEAEATAFYSALSIADKARADAAGKSTEPPVPPQQQRSEPPATPPTPPQQRNEPPATPPTPATPAEAARQAIEAERTRVRSLRELAGQDVPTEILTRAIDEGWDETRASREFLTAVRSGRQPDGQQQGDPNFRPAIHGRSHAGDATIRALGMGLMLRENGGFNPVERFAQWEEGTFRRIANPNQNQDLLRAADAAWQFRDLSLVDLCREACRIEFGRIPASRQECIRTAVSGSTLSAIFTVNVSAQLLAGWSDARDTTVGWCSEADVPNFLTNERAQMGKFGQLQKLARGDTAKHLDIDDKKEEYKIARYAGQFVLDEQDIINDRWGSLEQVSPTDMGLTARQLRPNLVYATLLANAALSDSVALFHNTHGNSTTGALNAANLQASLTLMGKQRMGRANDAAAKKRALNVRGRYLIVPVDLQFAAAIIVQSAQRIISADSGGTYNPLADYGLTVVSDDRIGVNGVWDPNAEVPRVGTAANYFVAAKPGEEGAKTLEVGYLRGTGRMPQLRSFTLDKGQWGLGWDINVDIGCKALDHKGLLYSTGA